MKYFCGKFSALTLAVSALAGHGAWASGTFEPLTFSPDGGAKPLSILGSGNFDPSGSALMLSGSSRVARDLAALTEEFQAYQKQSAVQGAAIGEFKTHNSLAQIVSDTVLIDATASDDPKALAAELRKLGAQKIAVFGRKVSGRIPLSAISSLNQLPSLHFARPSYAVTNSGTVTSQGDAAMRANIARSAFSVNGTGVKVGTLSDSYNCLGGAAAGVTSGDLPSGVTVLEEENGCASGSDEGRAMMEIIHDIAPGASLAFHSAFNGEADFAQGIIDLANAGASVINDDVIYFSEPFYQDGIIAQAVDIVKARGVAYFSSSGNQHRQAYEAPFRSSRVFFNLSNLGKGIAEAHDFDPGPGVDYCQQVTIPTGRSLILDYQWDQPFFSVSGGKGARSDMDIILTDASCSVALTAGLESNVGADPIEVTGGTNTGSTTTFGIIILHSAGPKPKLMKMLNFGSSSATFDEYDTQSGASFGHSAALGALGVGAADYLDTPAFGATPPVIEGFSSAGGSPILFNTSGKRLSTPDVRQQPDITAPDGVDTTFFGSSDSDSSGYLNFFGTSAAAPHAAGVAALLKDLVPALTPDETYAALKTTAIDMDDPSTSGFDNGFDYASGFGLIQADAALDAVSPQASVNDLAVTKITASKSAKGAGPVTRAVSVIIQNRSPHDETITVDNLGNGVTTGLVRLNVNVIDDDGESCAPAQIVLDTAKTLKSTKILKPKKTLTVKYRVTYHCSGASKSGNDISSGDYGHDARVYHEVLDGNPDSHIVDDICRRSVTPPFSLDANPDSTIKDKGCGAKKADKTFGNPVVTNLLR